MQKSALSARQAALLLGFKTANPILDAIKAGELEAYQRPARRNGGAGRFEVQREALERWAKPRGLDLADAPRPELESVEALSEIAEPLSNVSRIVALPTPPNMVTIPVEHYAALVAARGELEFIRRDFELTWHGQDEHEALYGDINELRQQLDSQRTEIARLQARVSAPTAPRRGRKAPADGIVAVPAKGETGAA